MAQKPVSVMLPRPASTSAFSLSIHAVLLPIAVTEAGRGSDFQNSCILLCLRAQDLCDHTYISAELSGRNGDSEVGNSEKRMRILLVQYCGEWIITARLESHNTGVLRHVFVILKHFSFYSGPDTGLS